MSKQFEMPSAYLGQVVRWKAHPGSQEGGAAFVTALGTHCLGLLVFHNGIVGGMPYDGVMHETDPKFDQSRNGDRGVWGYVEDQDDYFGYALSKAPKAVTVQPVKEVKK